MIEKNYIACKCPHSAKELFDYLEIKGNNHKNYKYYAKRNYIETILRAHTIYLSDGSNWNDVEDKKRLNHPNSSFVNYAMCFSFSKSENVAMWMLYSKDSGCMIDFTKEIIRDIIETDNLQIGSFVCGEFVPVKTLTHQQFKIALFDMIYYEKQNNKIVKQYKQEQNEQTFYYIKRADEVNRNFEANTIDEISYQKKRLAWSYENECRLVVSIDKKQIYANQCNVNQCNVVAIEFSESYIKKLMSRVFDSPNTSKSSIYRSSALQGKINWNLCSDCKIKEYR